LDPTAVGRVLKKQGLLTNVKQEHGQRPDWNKNEQARNKQQDRLNTLGKRDTGGNNQGVAGNNQDRNRQAQGRRSRETGNEKGTSKQNRKHSKS